MVYVSMCVCVCVQGGVEEAKVQIASLAELVSLRAHEPAGIGRE